MSIAAIISEGEELLNNDKEIYIPIATEKDFKKIWVPIIDKLDLKWINLFNVGLDVTKEELQEVLYELDILKKWANDNLGAAVYERLNERIDNLVSMLNEVFEYEGVTVFIG